MPLPTPFGKVSVGEISTDGTTITENLGYTKANPFSTDSTDVDYMSKLKTFTSSFVTGLTTNTYRSSSVTYEVSLDDYSSDASE